MIKKVLQLAVGIIVVAICLYFALREVDTQALWAAIGTIDVIFLVPAILVLLYTQWSRSLRWIMLLAHTYPNLRSFNAFSATMSGNFVNNIITRFGELVRPYIFAKREAIPLSTVLGATVAERGFDVIAIVFFALVVAVGAYSHLVATFPELVSLLAKSLLPTAAVLIVLVLLLFTPLSNVVVAIPKKIFPPAFAQKVIGLWHSFGAAFKGLSQGQVAKILLRTFEMWGLFIGVTYCTLLAFPFYESFDYSIMMATVITFVGIMAFMVAPTPAAIGVYHLFIQTLLTSMYGVETSTAAAFAVVAHAVHYGTHFVVGALLFVREQYIGGLAMNFFSLDKNKTATVE